MGSGFSGWQLADELSERNKPFLIAARINKLDVPNQNSVSVGDIDGRSLWSSALFVVTDVVHLAARLQITTETSSDAFSVSITINTGTH